MVAATHAYSQPVRSKTWAFVGIGVVAALVTLLLSGAATAIYFTEGLRWVGVLFSIMLVAAVIWLAGHWPATGVTAGAVLALFMVVFAITGTSPSSRPSLDFSGVIVFGGAGLLSAALVAAYLTSSIAMSRARRSKE
jgi:hypothetical protein